jgi:hypothetical protein
MQVSFDFDELSLSCYSSVDPDIQFFEPVLLEESDAILTVFEPTRDIAAPELERVQTNTQTSTFGRR